MDLQTAVTISMLAVSRVRACSLYRELRDRNPHTSIATLLDALQIPFAAHASMEDEACRRADAAMTAARHAGMGVVAGFAPGYRALRNCPVDPPPVLWTRGSVATLNEPAVAVVGSRAATTY